MHPCLSVCACAHLCTCACDGVCDCVHDYGFRCCMSMCMCVHVCVFTCAHAHVRRVYTHEHARACACVCMCVHVCKCNSPGSACLSVMIPMRNMCGTLCAHARSHICAGGWACELVCMCVCARVHACVCACMTVPACYDCVCVHTIHARCGFAQTRQ